LRKLVGFVLALPLVLLLAGSVQADELTSAELSDPVPGADGFAYLDLVRQIVPDITPAQNHYEGGETVEIRHIDPEQAAEAPETLRLDNVIVLPARSDGKERLLLMLDLGDPESVVEGYTVLAMFNVAGAPKLVDAAAVDFDTHTGFHEPPRLSLGEGKDLVLTRSYHFNSSQGYNITALILIRNDRLQLVDTFFTFHDRSCTYVRDEVLDVRAGDRDGRTYSDIVVTVTETTVLEGNDGCGDGERPTPGTRTATATYRWDDAASRFVPDSDAIKKLEEENMERL
jgi:hypothetical protein